MKDTLGFCYDIDKLAFAWLTTRGNEHQRISFSIQRLEIQCHHTGAGMPCVATSLVDVLREKFGLEMIF